MNRYIFAFIFTFALIISTNSFGRSFRVSQIPNGSVNGCANCHVNPAGGGARNAFGSLVEKRFLSAAGAAGQVLWSPVLASYDADSDGISNGEELQDPFGEWTIGSSNPGNASLVSKPGDPASKTLFNATLQITGMTPHLNKKFELRVVDKMNGKEVFRYKNESIDAADFNVDIQNIQSGHSYWLDFYADHNGNGRYDVPPTDHAWRLELNNAAGNESIPFAHNTSFTDVKWKYMLTLNFTGMTPHLGQLLEIRVKDDSTQIEVGRTRIESVASADFNVQMPVLWSDRDNYTIQFYADFSKNGLYDAPPADHAYELHLNNNSGDTTLTFAHNTNFTDINWKYSFKYNLIGMTPHVSQLMGARLLSGGDELEVSKLSLFQIPQANFTLNLYGVELNKDYHFDFFADHNGDGMYQDPPTDHAWKTDFNSGSKGDVVLNFTHNTNFTNIAWPYNTTDVERDDEILPEAFSLKQNYPNPFNPTTKIKFTLPAVETSYMTSLRVYNILGKEITTLINKELSTGTYEIEFSATNAGSNLSSGIYFYQLKAGSFSEVRKMMLMK